MKDCWITPIIFAALALLFASALHIVGLKGKMSLHAPGEEKEAEADKFHSRSCLFLPSEFFICWWVSSWNSLHPLVVPAENACLVPPSSGLNANHFSTHLNKSWISLQPSLNDDSDLKSLLPLRCRRKDDSKHFSKEWLLGQQCLWSVKDAEGRNAACRSKQADCYRNFIVVQKCTFSVVVFFPMHFTDTGGH